MVCSVCRTIGDDNTVLDDIYNSRLSPKAFQIIKDSTGHPAPDMFDLWPSGKQHHAIKWRISRHARRFFSTSCDDLDLSTLKYLNMRLVVEGKSFTAIY